MGRAKAGLAMENPSEYAGSPDRSCTGTRVNVWHGDHMTQHRGVRCPN